MTVTPLYQYLGILHNYTDTLSQVISDRYKVTDVQASELKQWLISVATKVAEAHREGDVMGLGSSRVSDKENDMLKTMSEALGL